MKLLKSSGLGDVSLESSLVGTLSLIVSGLVYMFCIMSFGVKTDIQ